VHRHLDFTSQSHMFDFHESCRFDRLILENVHQTCAEGASAPLWKNRGATFKQLIERDSITETVEK
jgi:hypothetical protein